MSGAPHHATFEYLTEGYCFSNGALCRVTASFRYAFPALVDTADGISYPLLKMMTSNGDSSVLLRLPTSFHSSIEAHQSQQNRHQFYSRPALLKLEKTSQRSMQRLFLSVGKSPKRPTSMSKKSEQQKPRTDDTQTPLKSSLPDRP